ncbi:hypothetical protein UPYG_G00129620 [Umbra pygmaea]|uniref:Band 7 domain-containing protein n=1 Tax=Umbra pygmaea TaxID=75934 RepID=A0ABD0XAM4_UMBPY
MEHHKDVCMKREAVIRNDLMIEPCTEGMGRCGWIAVIMCGIWTFCTFPWAVWCVIKIAVILKLGGINSKTANGPGIFFTKDSVTVCGDGVVYFRVSDHISSETNVTNTGLNQHSSHFLAQYTMRNVLGTQNQVERPSHSMQESLDEATSQWGINVECVETKDVKLPQKQQRAMAAEAEAS